MTFKRGIVNKVLWDWYHAIATGDFKCAQLHDLRARPSGSEDVLEFQLADAFPAKWIGPGAGRRSEQPRDRNAGSGASGLDAKEVSDAQCTSSG